MYMSFNHSIEQQPFILSFIPFLPQVVWFFHFIPFLKRSLTLIIFLFILPILLLLFQQQNTLSILCFVLVVTLPCPFYLSFLSSNFFLSYSTHDQMEGQTRGKKTRKM